MTLTSPIYMRKRLLSIVVPKTAHRAPPYLWYILTGLVEDLAVHLHGDQVLLLGVAGAVDECHPVARVAAPVHEVAQFALQEDLFEIRCMY